MFIILVWQLREGLSVIASATIEYSLGLDWPAITKMPVCILFSPVVIINVFLSGDWVLVAGEDLKIPTFQQVRKPFSILSNYSILFTNEKVII